MSKDNNENPITQPIITEAQKLGDGPRKKGVKTPHTPGEDIENDPVLKMLKIEEETSKFKNDAAGVGLFQFANYGAKELHDVLNFGENSATRQLLGNDIANGLKMLFYPFRLVTGFFVSATNKGVDIAKEQEKKHAKELHKLDVPNAQQELDKQAAKAAKAAGRPAPAPTPKPEPTPKDPRHEHSKIANMGKST